MSDTRTEPGIPRVLILGIGNVLWADEGFGVRTVQALHAHYAFADNVTLMDGGTQGIYLIQHVQAADVLLVFDAIDYGLPPGEMKLIRDGDVPTFMGAKKMSLHQTGFQEVLSTAQLMGHYPKHLLLVGVQPVELEDYGGSLRPAVKAQIQPAIEAALAWLSHHGIQPIERDRPLSAEEAISAPQLNLDHYETGRPSTSDACRLGDDRVLANNQYTFDPKPSLLEPGGRSFHVDKRRQD